MDAEFFAGNRRRLREKVRDDLPIVLTANGLLQKNVHSAFPFRQDSNFWYLTGISEPGLVLVIDDENDYLILPKQSQVMKLFDGEIDKSKVKQQSGISKVYQHEQGWSELAKGLKKSKKAAILEPPPAFVDYIGLYTNPARADLKKRLLEQNSHLKLVDIRGGIGDLRAIKQPEEILAIKQATKATIEVFELLKRNLSKRKSERELTALASKHLIDRGLRYAYEPVVAGGINATTLHYEANDQPYAPTDLVLLDIGAECQGYASDISRTWGVKPTKRQAEIHSAVMEVYEYALDILKPGVDMKDYEKRVRKLIGEKLVELGIIKKATKAAMMKFYPQLTSHCIGLDAHDPFPSDFIFKPGMVVSCEPAIYVKKEAIGVRIEDIVLVTKDGIENLSVDLSHGVQAL